MRVAIVLISLASLLASPAAAQRSPIGIFFFWGAFQEPGRCFAISAALNRSDARPAASVGYWPARGARGQVHFRLSGEKRPGSALVLRIDDRTFQLGGGGNNAWALNPGADADIVAAMRTGLEMSVETRSVRGRLIRDRYALRGAATAIDAAAIACATGKS